MRTERLKILRSFSEIYRVQGLEQKARQALRMMCETMDVSYGKLLLVSDDSVKVWLVFERSSASFVQQDEEISFHKAVFSDQREQAKSISGHVAATGKLIVIPDVEKYQYKNHFAALYLEKDKILSEIVAPIWHSDNVKWVLCLSSDRTDHFSLKQSDFYEIITTFLSSTLSEAFEGEEIAIEHQYDKLVLNAWNERLVKGHVHSINDLLVSLHSVLHLKPIGIYLVCPGDNSWIVTYAKHGVPRFLQPAPPQNEGFIFDTKTAQWRPSPSLVSFPLRDYAMKTIGYFTAEYFESLHGPFIRNLYRRFSAEVEALLGEERAVKASKLRTRIIKYEKKGRPDLTGERLHDLRLQIIDECNLSDIQYWIVDDSDYDLAFLNRNLSKYRIHRSDKCLVSEAWRSGTPVFKYGVRRENHRVIFPELVPSEETSWVGYPVIRVGKIVAIISFLGMGKKILTVQDLAAIETAAMILTTEMELQKANKELLTSRFIESHQISSHLQNAVGRIAILLRTVSKNETLRGSRLSLHLRNTKAFLRLAVRSLNLEGRPIKEITDFAPRHRSVFACVAETVSMVRALLHGEERNVDLYYEDFQVSSLFDSVSLQEALLAVLLNAAKYSIMGESIKIHYDKGQHSLEVRNLGIGIPPGESDMIFQQGIQGSNVRPDMALDFEKVSHGHRGLGLYVAREMIRRTGGDIRVKNPGTCFSAAKIISRKWKGVDISDEDYTAFEIRLPG
jgi:signal transduction histidine kinase